MNLLEFLDQFDFLPVEIVFEGGLNRPDIVADLHGNNILVFLKDLVGAAKIGVLLLQVKIDPEQFLVAIHLLAYLAGGN